MASVIDNNCDIPQWKKDLISRIRSKSSSTKTLSVESDHQLVGTRTPRTSSVITSDFGGHQPNSTCCTASVVDRVSSQRGVCVEKCKIHLTSVQNKKMVQERCWMDSKQITACDIVQENGTKGLDTDNPDEFRYGPGIVNKLKNRYLSLTLRENSARVRSSILPLRKATSLENILDNDLEEVQPKFVSTSSRIFESKRDECRRNAANRYRNTTRGSDQKRARSVETISRVRHDDEKPFKTESVHEEVFIITESIPADNAKKICDKNNSLNRPKRITPVISEKEKPPADVVQQVKKIFEGRPEKRTKAPHPTGEVAAKVATYKSIIVQTKVNNKKPPIKQKPVAVQNGDKRSSAAKPVLERKSSSTPDKEVEFSVINKLVAENGSTEPEHLIRPSQLVSHSDCSWISRQSSGDNSTLTSPIPDISRVKEIPSEKDIRNGNGLSETPDLLLHSSPTHVSCKISATKKFINVEIDHSNKTNYVSQRPCTINIKTDTKKHLNSLSNGLSKNLSPVSSPTKSPIIPVSERVKSPMRLDFETNDVNSFSKTFVDSPSNSFTYNLSKGNVSPGKHLPRVESPVVQKSFSPLLVEVNNIGKNSPPKVSPVISPLISPVARSRKPPVLKLENKENSPQIIKTDLVSNTTNVHSPLLATSAKKSINSPKLVDTTPNINNSLVANGVKVKSVEEVTRTAKPRRAVVDYQQNSIVFKFTDRKDVPDYVCNDGRIRKAKIERPKVGEGGIIILPGVSLDESVVDDEDDWLLLTGPPSPCDVAFINDNILIDGRSSLRDKSKKSIRVKLSFVDTVPEIFEYPSEESCRDEFNTNISAPGHTVPSLSGSTLANYIPKSAFEDFQLGLTRSVLSPSSNETKTDELGDSPSIQEASNPVLFSAGTNADILF